MKKKKDRRRSKLSPKKVCSLSILLVLVVFLSLPLIFKDPDEKQAQEDANINTKVLPLKTENPFTHYLKLLKNFYSADKNKNQKKEFKKTRNSLVARKTPSENYYFQEEQPSGQFSQGSSASASQYEQRNDGNYYNYDDVDINNLQNFNKHYTEQTQEHFVEQKPFEDFAMEGLYETSQTDPFEVKQASKRTLFDILTPPALPLLAQAKQDNYSLINTFANDDTSLTDTTFDKNSLNSSVQHRNTNYRRPALSYFSKPAHTGIFDSFTNASPILRPLDISDLPFDAQADLVSGRLNTIREANYAQSHSRPQKPGDNNKPNPQDPQDPHGPKPPVHKQNTFDPTKWDNNVKEECSFSAFEEEEPAPTEQNTNNSDNSDDKIDTCGPEYLEKINPVNQKMQQDYNYLIVSGRYNDRIMIPEEFSLADKVLRAIHTQDSYDNTLNLPQELRDENFKENTKQTRFNFVSELKPQVFDRIMQDEKTILLSVDPEDVEKYPTKTILIQSGEIENYSGANRIVDEINGFIAKQAELKKQEKQKEEEAKEQKTQDLKEKIESAI